MKMDKLKKTCERCKNFNGAGIGRSDVLISCRLYKSGTFSTYIKGSPDAAISMHKYLYPHRPTWCPINKKYNDDVVQNVSIEKTEIKKMDDIVTVVRYKRVLDEYGYAHNLGGVTYWCEINYTKEKITVFPAICSLEDNFSKQKGTSIARKHKQSGIGFVISYTPEWRDDPLLEAISSQLEELLSKIADDDKVYWLNAESKHRLEAPLIKLLYNNNFHVTNKLIFD